MTKSKIASCLLISLALTPQIHSFAASRHMAFFPQGLEGTADVIFGPADPATPAEQQAWREKLAAFRAERLAFIGMPSGKYPQSGAAWSDTAYRQIMLFMYDQAFIREGQYRTAAWLRETEMRLGKIDAVLLWQAYPQLGIDSRNQFDFYRQMPGGLAGIKEQVTDVLHAHGVRVVLDFNPWDSLPDYEELGRVVASLDADSVMLDTLDQAPAELLRALARHKPDVVVTPEGRPADEQMPLLRSSWAQWYDLGPGPMRPAIFRQKWLLPQHQQLSIRRWDTERRMDLVFSFFNGSGFLFWDNVFGTWNPYNAQDRKLAAETSVVLHGFSDVQVAGQWEPLLPSGVTGLDLNRWSLPSGRALLTFRNRTDQELSFAVPSETPRSGLGWYALWGAPQPLKKGDPVSIPAQGTQALALDTPTHATAVITELKQTGAQAAAADPGYEITTPEPSQLHAAVPAASPSAAPVEPGRLAHSFASSFVKIPGGDFEMVIQHARRESGCYPWGADSNAMWGFDYRDTLTHRIPSHLAPFSMAISAVTNTEFLRFVRESGYVPTDPARFLEQIARNPNGSWPSFLPRTISELPVTFVSLEDARAYARWSHTRLPSEAEWQWAAEGAGQGHLWPWGNEDPESLPAGAVNQSGKLVSARELALGATPQGVLGLTGNAWELTESEWSDGHNRYVMLRGGTFLAEPEQLSEWMLPRGAHPNNYHAKYFLLSGGVDRSAAIGFRVVGDFSVSH